MKKILLLTASVLLACGGIRGQVTNLSILEIASNYGIDSTFLTDTNHFQETLDAREQNYIALASECVDLSSKIQTMLYSLQHDYEQDQGNIWINHNCAIVDYPQYEPVLVALQNKANRLSMHYLQREQHRVEEQARMAELMEQEEQASRQEGRNMEAEGLKESITSQHAALTEQCKQSSLPKSVQKERKDLYYTYLALYNSYSFSEENASEEYIQQLQELRDMQRHMLDSVVCDSGSYAQRIRQFPARLKDSCGLRHNDVYRSYTRVFYHTSVPIAFTTLPEYYRYAQKMRDIIHTQNQYLKAIELRDSIRSNTDTMHARYWKRYKDVLSAYDEANASVNTLPAFTTVEGSIQYVADMRDYLNVQKKYLLNFARLETIDQRADSIVSLTANYKFSDIKNAYRKLPRAETFIPHFTTLAESAAYDSTLDDFEQLQANYIKFVFLRQAIASRHDSILNGENNERVFSNGYKKIRDSYDFTPSCTTAEQSYDFVIHLQQFLQFQDRCGQIFAKQDIILLQEKDIHSYETSRPNLYKAYKNLMKCYPNPEKISTIEEMQVYHNLLDRRIFIQQKFLSAFQSNDAEEIDYRIKKMSNTQVKLIFGLTD